MTTKERQNRKLEFRKYPKQPFPKIYANEKEDYELYETDEDQIRAVMVDLDVTRIGHYLKNCVSEKSGLMIPIFYF